MNPLLFIFLRLNEAANTTLQLDTPIPAVEGGGEWEVVPSSCYFTPDSNGAVATDGTNYITLALKSGSTTLASLTTNSSGGAALVANTKTALTDAGAAPTACELTAGTDLLTAALTKAGTGAVCKGILAIGIRRKQAKAYAN